MKYLIRLQTLITSGLSMYLVITLALFGLFGVAFTSALVGGLPFRPLDIVLSLTIFMGVSFAASYLFAYLFSVPAHHKSALITGGILFSIFSPVITLQTALLYSFIAVIAIASKYLLVWRGRHIFNPAAIAAVAVWLTGLQSASWWMADGALAIAVSILAFVVLYKTEKLGFAGVFLGVYLVVLVAVALASGQGFVAVGSSLLAWFPAFFVGFMLSEPLTLPPRKYQQLILAGIVAVLIGLHPSIGTFYLTPESALVVGNIVSFAIARRVGVRLTLVKRQKFPGEQEMFEFQSKYPLYYRAGQHLELNLPHQKTDLRGERRMFTIASAPESGVVRITTRYAQKSSTFKTQLQQLKKGDHVQATSIKGDFILPNKPQKLLLLAGGIGITPFVAQLESLQKQNKAHDIVLLYAVRDTSEVLFKDILQPKSPNIKTFIIAPDAKKSDHHAIKAEFLTPEIIATVVPDIKDRLVYISGSPSMVTSLKHGVKALGVECIKTDSFTGY